MTAMPCCGRTAERASSSRKITARTCEAEPFRVKKQCPDGGNDGVEISPSTQTSAKVGSPSSNARTRRLRSVTRRMRGGNVLACQRVGRSGATSAICKGRHRSILDPGDVLAVSGVDPNRVALVHEKRNLDDQASLQGGGLLGASRGVASKTGFGRGHPQVHGDRHVHAQPLAVLAREE